MPNEKLKPSFTIDEDRIKKLKKLVPEAFTDNQINWDTLKEALGEYLEDEDYDAEHFGLFWPGKREARKIASIESKGTLIPVPGEGINEENTSNIFIEGENLEVLKLLQKSYASRIKMIYIDPPYNTGNDFIYDDDFTEPIDEYLKRTGQLDEEGKPLTTNKKADGRFHSKWLSMMYPRLKLARNLLSDDGTILISIDDSESENLIIMMNEIFGEENFVSRLIWKSGRTASAHYTTEHEYIVVYSKNKESLSLFKYDGDEIISDRAIKRPNSKNPLSDISFPAGIEFFSKDTIFPKKFGNKEPVVVVDGIFEAKDKKLANKVTLRAAWSMRDQIIDWLNGNKVVDQKGQIVEKFYFKKNGVLQYLKKKGTIHPKSIIEGITTKSGSNEIEDLFGKKVFDFPKPTQLLLNLLEPIVTEDNSICMDFFSGSGSFGDSVYQLIDKGVKVNFILVQMRELLNIKEELGKNAFELGYRFIDEIAIDRLKKKSSIIDDNESDFGLKVFKLQKSNYKEWNDFEGTDVKQLEAAFGEHVSPLVDRWKEDNLLTEILLMEGFPLDSKIEEKGQYKKNIVYSVSSDFCEHKLRVCLDENVEEETIDTLEIGENDIFICLDSAITDQNKARLMDKGTLKTI